MMRYIRRFVYLAPLVLAHAARAEVSIDFPTSFAGFSTQDVKVVIQNIIRIILGFLGIITILIILYGGFMWMTSFGDEGKIDQSKKLISAGVIGLVIVLGSYAISVFVINSLATAV